MVSGNQEADDKTLTSIYREHEKGLKDIEKSYRRTLVSSNTSSLSALIDFGMAATRRRGNLTKLFMGLFSGMDANIAALADRHESIKEHNESLAEKLSKLRPQGSTQNPGSDPSGSPTPTPPPGMFIH